MLVNIDLKTPLNFGFKLIVKSYIIVKHKRHF